MHILKIIFFLFIGLATRPPLWCSGWIYLVLLDHKFLCGEDGWRAKVILPGGFLEFRRDSTPAAARAQQRAVVL
jgi:hypothetical protein